MVIISSPHYVSSLLLVALLLGGSRNPGAQGQARQEMPTVRPAAQLLPPSPGYRLPDGETYVYSVEWHMFNAGLARVSLDQSGNQQRVTAIADSLGAVNLMYPVHDRFQSFFDPRSFCSEEIVRHSEEGKRRRDTEVRFEYQRHKAVRNDKDLKTGD
ncbi:MAG: DUF3108 domain-containing protein, partial [Acidobacteria bacterium]|nr:DUF3108 domain-containing protein [Acidobacteriota bacterium]